MTKSNDAKPGLARDLFFYGNNEEGKIYGKPNWVFIVDSGHNTRGADFDAKTTLLWHSTHYVFGNHTLLRAFSILFGLK